MDGEEGRASVVQRQREQMRASRSLVLDDAEEDAASDGARSPRASSTAYRKELTGQEAAAALRLDDPGLEKVAAAMQQQVSSVVSLCCAHSVAAETPRCSGSRRWWPRRWACWRRTARRWARRWMPMS